MADECFHPWSDGLPGGHLCERDYAHTGRHHCWCGASATQEENTDA